MMSSDPDIFLLDRLKADDPGALKMLFDQHFPAMMRQAFKLTQSKEVSEELVQDVFIYIWSVRNKINIQITLKAYLMRAIKNRCYTYFKRELRNNQVEFNDHIAEHQTPQADESINQRELHAVITAAIFKLPKKTRAVFVMSRDEEMSYKEIAQKLGVSVKTVEYHMGSAFKLLREFIGSSGYLIIISLFS